MAYKCWNKWLCFCVCRYPGLQSELYAVSKAVANAKLLDLDIKLTSFKAVHFSPVSSVPDHGFLYVKQVLCLELDLLLCKSQQQCWNTYYLKRIVRLFELGHWAKGACGGGGCVCVRVCIYVHSFSLSCTSLLIISLKIKSVSLSIVTELMKPEFSLYIWKSHFFVPFFII